MNIAQDATVVFTEDNLPLMEAPDSRAFTGWVVTTGDKGQYVGPSEIPGYHLIAVTVEGRVYYCPARADQFTVERA